MPISEIERLCAIAMTEGRNSASNFEGGINPDVVSDNEIIECLVDIGNGEPYKLGVSMDELGEMTEHRILDNFYAGYNDR